MRTGKLGEFTTKTVSIHRGAAHHGKAILQVPIVNDPHPQVVVSEAGPSASTPWPMGGLKEDLQLGAHESPVELARENSSDRDEFVAALASSSR